MDLELKETLNGGDLVKTTKDLSVIFGFENDPYLALFGGNVKQSTPVKRMPNEQSYDYWANGLLFGDNQATQFNSETERVLNNTALNSNGRNIIEQAVKKDLKYMTAFAQVGVSVTLPKVDTVLIAIAILQPDNLEDRGFVFLWDATKLELEAREFTPDGHVFGEATGDGFFDFTFDDTFE